MSRRKVIFSILGGLAVMMFFAFTAHAGWFFADVPKGTEIKDSYLEQLFAPEFPYEWVKVIDTKEGERYVIVKAKRSLTKEQEYDYEKKTLFSRKIVTYRSASVHSDRLLIAEMKMYRIVSTMPYVVEYCMVENKKVSPLLASEAEDVVRRDGKYLIIRINKNFGRVFKKVEIYPEKDTPCPVPPFIGKYPKAKSLYCAGGNKRFVFAYVSKDKAEDIYKYYTNKLESHYKKVGFNFPEDEWKYTGTAHNLGMQIKDTEAEQWGSLLDREGKNKPLKLSPPSNGVVFNILIYRGSPKSFIEGFSFVRIYYTVDPGEIKKNIELWGK